MKSGYAILKAGICYLLVIMMAFVFTACDKRQSNLSMGAMTGMILLSDAKADTHGGTLVFLPGTSLSARTDQAGRWTMTSVVGGTYQVMAEHAGYRTINIGKFTCDPKIHQPGQALVIPTVVMEKDESATTGSSVGSIVGAVAVLDADLSDNVNVLLEGTDMTTVTDELGNYRFDSIEPGRYVLTFTKEGYQQRQTSLLVSAGETPSRPRDIILEPIGGSKMLADAESKTTLTIKASSLRQQEDSLTEETLKGNCTITGSVQVIDADGSPITDYTRVIVAIDNSDYQSLPDTSGRFSFSKLPHGYYRVFAVLDGGIGLAYIDVDLSQQEAISVVLKVTSAGAQPLADESQKGTINGSVVLYGPDGIELDDYSGVMVGCLGSNDMTLTKQDGAFSLSMPHGSYTVQLSKQGYNTGQVSDVEVVGGRTTDIGTIGMEPVIDAPFVTSTIPSNGDKNVTLSEKLNITVIFSKAMNEESVLGAVSVKPNLPFKTYIGSGTHPKANNQTLIIEVSNQQGKTLDTKQDISVSIAKSATDLEGNELREPYSFSFNIGGYGIIATSPADGQVVNYLPGSMQPVDIYFNCVLQPSQINSSTLKISPMLSGVHAVPVILNNPQTGWSFIRFLPYLQGGKEFRVTVNRGLKTTDGRKVGGLPYTFSFRLEEMRETGAPSTPTRRRR